MLVNADLHIHSKYSIGVSKYMTIKNLAREAKRKGIQLIGTGDCLHPKWLEEIEALEEIDEGTFELESTRFVLTAEVTDSSRVHHVLIFPSKSATNEFRERIKKASSNLEKDGRPYVRLGGEEIAQHAKDLDIMIGAAHAFTPWTSLYASHDSLEGSYGELVNYVSFIELGLSADTSYADRIAELADLTFLTSSDAHSPYPAKLAREFTRFEMSELTYDDLRKAILRTGSNKAALNVGLPPQEGKYNETACTRCYTHFLLRDAIVRKWRCRCGGLIKKGVKDRVAELATYEKPIHPEHRPNYLHLIPLAEIIMKALKMKSPFTKKVLKEWNILIENFKNEVAVLIDVPIEEIRDRAREEVSEAILMFREDKVFVRAGGGGQYGCIVLPGSEDFENEKVLVSSSPQSEKGEQRRLLDF